MSNIIINQTVAFVKETLVNAEGGHDWSHIERVWRLSEFIHRMEGKGDRMVIELAALLHDISDAKFNNGDELTADENALEWTLVSSHVDRTIYNARIACNICLY